MTPRAPCLLCARPAGRRLRVAGHAIYRCRDCDFEFVHPAPTAAALARVYGEGYFTGAGAGYRDYFGAERADADRKARDRVARLVALGARAGGRVLDVGCADGRFLLAARDAGLAARGVEPSGAARARLDASLRGAVDATLEDAAGRGPYDVVTLWDTLEHLADPLDALARVRALLAADALVGVVVPVIDNVTSRRLPWAWDQYKPPEHLWYFSRRALRATLERALGGRVVWESSAWRREARVLDARVRAAGGAIGRAARTAEGVAWRLAARTGALGAHPFDDAVLMVARVARPVGA